MENSIEAVRLALSVEEMRSRNASQNIAQASNPDARAQRVAFPEAEALLNALVSTAGDAAGADFRHAEMRVRAAAGLSTNEPIQVDREIGDMVSASTSYQALTEALSRQFGLMRLAITGRN